MNDPWHLGFTLSGHGSSVSSGALAMASASRVTACSQPQHQVGNATGSWHGSCFPRLPVPGAPKWPSCQPGVFGVDTGTATALRHLCANAHLLLRSLSFTGLRLRLLCSPSFRLLLPSFLSDDSFSSSAAVSASLLACAQEKYCLPHSKGPQLCHCCLQPVDTVMIEGAISILYAARMTDVKALKAAASTLRLLT